MKKIDNWYVIPKIRLADYTTVQKILKILLADNHYILFSKFYIKFEDIAKEYQYETIERYYSYFLKGILYLENDLNLDIQEGIKEILYKKYGKKNLVEKDIEKETLYNDFLKDQNFIDKNTIDEIKFLITSKRENYPKEKDIFIKDRIVFKNHECFCFAKMEIPENHDWKNSYTAWYKAEGDDEINTALKINFDIEAIVTKDLENFENYDYAVTIVDNINFILAINDQVGDFKERIEPKIKKEFGDKYKIIHNGTSKREPIVDTYVWDSED